MGWHGSMAFRDCPWCGLTHAQMGFHATAEADAPGRPPRTFSLLSCPDCAGAIVVETNSRAANPPQEFGSFPSARVTSDVDHLPDDVASYYSDAIKVLRAGIPDAAAVQLRRTLEAAAAHYNVDEKTLVKSIEKLIAEGHVTAAFGGALHHIRQVGNLGAHHTDERVDEETARRALRFTTTLLRDLFEVPAELAALQSEEDQPHSP
ncbi:MAG: hypothetical protein QOH80_170 [Actinomycetota bacterium]|nr:hypothetical protein [Actinomycetota bacterium]